MQDGSQRLLARLRDGFEPRVTFEGQEADTARGLVGAGLGVSLVPATASSLADPADVPVRVTEPRGADGRHRLVRRPPRRPRSATSPSLTPAAYRKRKPADVI
jgi:DNA-binding transcriptional LysR family regulator